MRISRRSAGLIASVTCGALGPVAFAQTASLSSAPPASSASAPASNAPAASESSAPPSSVAPVAESEPSPAPTAEPVAPAQTVPPYAQSGTVARETASAARSSAPGDDDEPTALPRGNVDEHAEERAWLRRMRASSVHRWNRHLGVGLTVGAGSPLGAIGAFVQIDPAPWLGLSLGGGSGATFGPAAGGMVQVRPFHTFRHAGWFGLGASTAFTPALYRSTMLLTSPTNSWWMHLVLGYEHRAGRGIVVRLSAGIAILLNTGAFTFGTVGGVTGPPGEQALGTADPVTAADQHVVGAALVVPSFAVDLVNMFDF